jgi:hypothetical protein
MPFAYDFIENRENVTTKRCDVALEEGKKYGKSLCCIFTSGYNRKNPTSRPNDRRLISLAEQMGIYVKAMTEKTFGCGLTIYCKPLGWGTLSEMIWAIRIAKYQWEFGFDTTVIISSSVDHLPRIKKYAGWIMPKEWRIIYTPVDHRLNENWKERLKYIRHIPYLVWLKTKMFFGFPL